MATSRRQGSQRCSFCGREQDQVSHLIRGPGDVYICDECVELCRQILSDNDGDPARKREPPAGGRVPTPREIVRALGQHVVGQER